MSTGSNLWLNNLLLVCYNRNKFILNEQKTKVVYGWKIGHNLLEF